MVGHQGNAKVLLRQVAQFIETALQVDESQPGQQAQGGTCHTKNNEIALRLRRRVGGYSGRGGGGGRQGVYGDAGIGHSA